MSVKHCLRVSQAYAGCFLDMSATGHRFHVSWTFPWAMMARLVGEKMLENLKALLRFLNSTHHDTTYQNQIIICSKRSMSWRLHKTLCQVRGLLLESLQPTLVLESGYSDSDTPKHIWDIQDTKTSGETTNGIATACSVQCARFCPQTKSWQNTYPQKYHSMKFSILFQHCSQLTILGWTQSKWIQFPVGFINIFWYKMPFTLYYSVTALTTLHPLHKLPWGMLAAMTTMIFWLSCWPVIARCFGSTTWTMLCKQFGCHI